MAERYQEWFSLPSDLFVDGSPIFIKSGKLFYDTFKDAFFVKLCFKNNAYAMIKRVTVGLIPLDMTNRPLTADQPYVYANLFAGSGAEFGKLVEIPLSGGNALHSFSVYVSEVRFDDGSVWTTEDREWLSYSERQQLIADRRAAEAAEAEAARERAARRAEKDAKRAAENEARRARFMEEYKAWTDMAAQMRNADKNK